MGENLADSNVQAKPFFTVGDKAEFEPERWASSTAKYRHDNGETSLPKRDAGTHVKVLIVGAGYAGLMAALECWRKGHDVVGILERSDGPNFSGDLIIIQPSALDIMRHWPQMRRELEQDKVTVGTYYYRHNGELIDGPVDPNFNAPEHVNKREGQPGGFPSVGTVQIRQKFYRMLLRQVARLGFTVDYGKRVDNYFEDESAGLGGVVLTDGTVRTADVGRCWQRSSLLYLYTARR
jgi:2-polyprenyl-6-methoxyphenol hydroxylase-like FAD-dependent oxidoreductase